MKPGISIALRMCITLLLFAACDKKQPKTSATFEELVDKRVWTFCDSTAKKKNDIIKTLPGCNWWLDTLHKLAYDFPPDKDSATNAAILLESCAAYGMMGHHDSACYYAEKVLPYFEKHPTFIRQLGKCYFCLGNGLRNSFGNIFKANYYCTKAAAISLLPAADTLIPLENRIQMLYVAADANIVCQQNEQALRFAREAYRLAYGQRDKAGMGLRFGRAIGELITIYIENGNYDSAKRYIQIADTLSVYRSPNYHNDLLNRKYQYFYALKQYDSSLKYESQVVWEDQRKLNGLNTMFGLYMNLRNRNEAGKYYRAASALMDSTADGLDVKMYNFAKVRYLNLYGSDKEATDKAFVVYDSLLEDFYNAERLKVFSSIESEYNLADKEKNINRLNETNREARVEIRQKNILLVVSILGLLLFIAIIFGLLLLSRQRKLKAANVRIEAQRDKIELEQRLLRTQMEPHFIFNTLNVMQGFILKNENDKANMYLSKFARLLRASLENSRENYVPVPVEVEALQDYVALQMIRYGDKFDCRMNVYDGYEHDAIKIPPMLLQPFVENAIMHGIWGVAYRGEIVIDIRKEYKVLHCTISDNGKGIDNTRLLNTKSLAIRIARERLVIAGNEMNVPADISIQNRPTGSTGTVVDLVIPFTEG